MDSSFISTTSATVPGPSFLDLPREIYDEIVDICLALGGIPLLRKCSMVHTALLPRVYTYLFANISFYSCTESSVHVRNTRTSTFISILKRRPYVAQMIKSVTLHLHEDNDWLVEETGFLTIMRLFRELGAHPTRLSVCRLPGIEFIRLPTHHKFETEVIRLTFSSSVKYLTIRDCEHLQRSFLSAFSALEELVLDRISLSAATFKYNPSSLPKIRRLEILRCIQDDGIPALLNPWCGLPFNVLELRELQCPVESMVDVAFVQRSLMLLGHSTLEELRLIIDVGSNQGRLTLGRLTFADTPYGILHLRLTLLFKCHEVRIDSDYYRSMVDIITSLVSSGLHPTTTRLTIDFPEGWLYPCYDLHETLWEGLRKQLELWTKKDAGRSESGFKLRQQTRLSLDFRLNFVITSPPKNLHQAIPHSSSTQDHTSAPILERHFPGWYTFEYMTSTLMWSVVPFRHGVYYSAHSVWPHPLSFPELGLGTLE